MKGVFSPSTICMFGVGVGRGLVHMMIPCGFGMWRTAFRWMDG